MVTMALPDSWSIHLQSLDTSEIFASKAKFGEIATFACEVAIDNVVAQKKLALYLYSAQYQRQVLGFKNGQIFGATIVRDTLTMYCSKWDNETVVCILILTFCVC
jgi:hypothetical protein